MRYTNKNKFRGLFFGNRLGFYYKDTLQLSDREIRLINSLKFRPSDFFKNEENRLAILAEFVRYVRKLNSILHKKRTDMYGLIQELLKIEYPEITHYKVIGRKNRYFKRRIYTYILIHAENIIRIRKGIRKRRKTKNIFYQPEAEAIFQKLFSELIQPFPEKENEDKRGVRINYHQVEKIWERHNESLVLLERLLHQEFNHNKKLSDSKRIHQHHPYGFIREEIEWMKFLFKGKFHIEREDFQNACRKINRFPGSVIIEINHKSMLAWEDLLIIEEDAAIRLNPNLAEKFFQNA